MRSRLKPIKDFAGMLKTPCASRILPFIESKLTNAISEGLNRIIKIVKKRANGFANLDALPI